MAFGDDDDLPNEVLKRVDISQQSIGSPNVTRASLASIESLTMPLMQEVVLSADIRCAECQKRVADVMSRMSGSCLWMKIIGPISTYIDSFKASSAQSAARTWKNHNLVWPGQDPETESVVVNVLEKKVTLCCRYPDDKNGVKSLRPQVPVVYRNPLKLYKVATIKRLFRISSS